jgi:hypothetical protein
MNPSILNLITILILTVIFCASIKVSARMLRYQDITWKQCLTFGFIIVIATLMASFLIQPNRAAFIVLPLYLLFGGWFFRNRGTKRSGEILGWRGAISLAGIAIFLVGITMIALFNAFKR